MRACARLDSEKSIENAGRKLIDLCRQGWLLHRIDAVEHAAGVMLGLPLRIGTRNVARYYQAYCLARRGDAGRAAEILDRIIDRVDAAFRPRATLALANTYYYGGRLRSSAPIYLEAARVAAHFDPLTEAQALRMLAVIRSIDGDHNGALTDLERLLPFMHRLAHHYPSDYYDYLNSLAIELGEIGRIEEANRAIDIILASPLASRFPHWLDTKLELATKPRRAFTPFVMALGSPAAPMPSYSACQAEPAQEPRPSPSVAAIKDPMAAEHAAQKSPSRVIEAAAVRHWTSLFLLAAQQAGAAESSTIGVRNERFLAAGRGRPRSLSGYAISPPSRAPPVR
ncbi:MAG TPA: hypothetical protein VJX67_05415 [Blastocatellia bacterium]|nr:hypothetical protein [Blastocatellia bacterium]